MTASASTAEPRYVDHEVVQRAVKGADALALMLAGLVASSAPGVLAARPDAPAIIGFMLILLALSALLVLRGLGLYQVSALVTGRWTFLKSLSAAFIVGGTIYLAITAMAMPLPQDWLPSWFALLALHFGVTRFALQSWAKPLAAAGRFRKRIAIVGGGTAAEEALNAIESSKNIDVEIVGLFDDRFDARSPESVRRHRKIGRIDELEGYGRAHRVDLIVVAIPLSAEARLLQILKRIWELPIDIRISGQSSSLKLSPRAYTYLGNLPLLAVFDRPLKGWSLVMKNAMDKVLACVAIALLSPVMLLTALAVRLDSKGPVIFKQRRYGFNNELIEVYKFRSMHVNLTDADATKLVTKGDPRVTRVGRIIRKTSLDELPQLLNVLTGQLSLVGPRPHATQAKAANALYEQVVDGYFARHKVKPGITGWAQINGWRGETDTREKIEQRVKHDLEYIDRWSLAFDLVIIAKTPFALLKSENAY
ncbi:MAG: undecaprenyl-phosphate glucose phosphotransferase [Rhizobiales bacterium]|nr:undecaprenyl-phosphate glucose phosphotransferase [Hyphomicrobiales bacterium]